MSPSTVSRYEIGDRGLTFEQLPQPDYRSHPAYGGAFASPSLTLRVRALGRFLPWFGLVLVKRLLMWDRLPTLDDYAPTGGGIRGRLVAFRRYLPLVVRGLADEWSRTLSRQRPVEVSPGGRKLLETLRRDGIVVARLKTEEINQIRDQVAQPLAELLAQREQPETRTFESNQKWLNVRNSADLYGLIGEVFSCHGILDTASMYLGRPVQIKHLMLQVNDPGDHYQYDKFADVALPDPATNYMHVDTSEDMLKCMILLNEVGERNGPFCYVRGSARLNVGAFEGLVRRTTDRAGLSGYARPTREMFMGLPAALRYKCTFGSDLLDGSPESKALLEAEYRFTSADGNIAMFDNLGIHRGAFVLEGDRRVLFATLG